MFASVRLPDDLAKRLDAMAKDLGVSKSAIIRKALGQYITNYNYEDVNINWKPRLWKMLGLDIVNIDYALSHSDTAEEFFSFLNRWTTLFDITTNISENAKLYVYMKSTRADYILQAACDAYDEKIMIISKITEQLYEAFIEKLEAFADV